MINQAISSWMEKRIDQPKNIKATGTNNACTFKKGKIKPQSNVYQVIAFI